MAHLRIAVVEYIHADFNVSDDNGETIGMTIDRWLAEAMVKGKVPRDLTLEFSDKDIEMFEPVALNNIEIRGKKSQNRA